jgi:hypothetical protein
MLEKMDVQNVESTKNEAEEPKKKLPDIDLVATASGITVYCPNWLKTPRYIPYDVRGQCPQCKGADLDVDYVLLQTGLTISANRMKATIFVPFDSAPANYMHDGIIRIKNRRKHFTIPFKSHPTTSQNGESGN